jgi:uncharacterized membrane protein
MRNKKLLTIKKVNEERLFRNWSEFWRWYQRQSGSQKDIFDRLDRSVLSAKQKEKFLVPLKGSGTFQVYGDKQHFTYQISIGKFIRTSGAYQICVLAVQRW